MKVLSILLSKRRYTCYCHKNTSEFSHLHSYPPFRILIRTKEEEEEAHDTLGVK